MTKEQEEAIKFLELHTNFMGKLDKGRCIRIPEENFTKTKQSIETVLNMLKEKDTEIEKKDKMMDLMAEYIDEDDTSLANYLYRKNGKCNKEMIKQYFERKATNDG
ncbi:MAG: hypothetical protein KIC54_03370 [Clostridium sp.]|jgi:hypothetical protein|nr:hypothetical protein [Clostridium sp.]